MAGIDAFLRGLDLRETGPGRFTAENIDHGTPVIFGGQLLAQAVVAAAHGQPGKAVKTVHMVFPRAGSAAAPVEIAVDPVHSGRSFASSTVSFSQGDRIFSRAQVLLASDEPDHIRHADAAPDVPGPEECVPSGQGDSAWEVRIVGGIDISDPDEVGPPVLDVWTRFAGAPTDPLTDQALLSFATDAFLIGAAMRPHEGVGQRQAHVSLSTGVISHTLTFHEPAHAGDWLLLSHRSSYAGHGMSYGGAHVFTRDGALVASYVQDAMIRPMPQRPGGSAL